MLSMKLRIIDTTDEDFEVIAREIIRRELPRTVIIRSPKHRIVVHDGKVLGNGGIGRVTVEGDLEVNYGGKQAKQQSYYDTFTDKASPTASESREIMSYTGLINWLRTVQ